MEMSDGQAMAGGWLGWDEKPKERYLLHPCLPSSPAKSMTLESTSPSLSGHWEEQGGMEMKVF